MTNGASEFDAAPEGVDARLRAVEQAVVRIQATLDSEFPRLRAEIGQLESGVGAKLAALETRIRMDERFASFESRMEARFDALGQRIERRMAVFETRIMEKQTSMTRWLVSVVVAALATMALV